MIFAIGKKKLIRSGTHPGQTRRSLLSDRPGNTCRGEDSGTGGLPVKRLGILISGRGSNFQAIANSIRDGRLEAEIAVVISNRESAAGLQVARDRGLNAVSLPSKGLDRTIYDRLLIDELRRNAGGSRVPCGLSPPPERGLHSSFSAPYPQYPSLAFACLPGT